MIAWCAREILNINTEGIVQHRLQEIGQEFFLILLLMDKYKNLVRTVYTSCVISSGGIWIVEMGIQPHCLFGLYIFVLQSHAVCWHQSKDEIIILRDWKFKRLSWLTCFYNSNWEIVACIFEDREGRHASAVSSWRSEYTFESFQLLVKWKNVGSLEAMVGGARTLLIEQQQLWEWQNIC